MEKVYVIIYEDMYGDGATSPYSSGVSYVFDSLDKAKNMLQKIKEDYLREYTEDNDYKKENILIEHETSIMFDLIDEYTKFQIVEMEVR